MAYIALAYSYYIGFYNVLLIVRSHLLTILTTVAILKAVKLV